VWGGSLMFLKITASSRYLRKSKSWFWVLEQILNQKTTSSGYLKEKSLNQRTVISGYLKEKNQNQRTTSSSCLKKNRRVSWKNRQFSRQLFHSFNLFLGRSRFVFFETRELRLSTLRTTLIPSKRGFGAISNNCPILVPTSVFLGTFFNVA
jgi:hypothetical protein